VLANVDIAPTTERLKLSHRRQACSGIHERSPIEDGKASAGEGMVLDLRALLNDTRRHNIGNYILHGVMPAENFNRQASLTVVHLVLLLGDLRV
jgi:hypothetical protein